MQQGRRSPPAAESESLRVKCDRYSPKFAPLELANPPYAIQIPFQAESKPFNRIVGSGTAMSKAGSKNGYSAPSSLVTD